MYICHNLILVLSYGSEVVKLAEEDEMVRKRVHVRPHERKPPRERPKGGKSLLKKAAEDTYEGLKKGLKQLKA